MERDLAKVEAAGSSPVSRFFHAKGYPQGYPFLHEMSPAGLKQNSENSVRGLRRPKVLFGRCYPLVPRTNSFSEDLKSSSVGANHWSPGPIAPSRAFFMQKGYPQGCPFLHEKSAERDKCCMQYFFGYYFMNRIFFAILLRIREK